MNEKFRKEIEKLTDDILKLRKKRKDDSFELSDCEKSNRFKSLITDHLIPLTKDASMIIGRSGCSLNYYSNELAVIRDPKKRIFIQILFYPYGHSKMTLGVNAPFLQFSYSPVKENIKITRKLSIKSDEGPVKLAEMEIDDLAEQNLDRYLTDFLKNVLKYNT